MRVGKHFFAPSYARAFEAKMPQLASSVREIRTKFGDIVLVDADRFDVDLFYRWGDGTSGVYRVGQIASWRWLGTRQNGKRHCGASVTVGGVSRLLYIHRLVTEAPPHLVVDHIDRDTANNTLTNLRLATNSQNQTNQRDLRPRASQYIGVRICKRDLAKGRKPYFAAIKHLGRKYTSGRFGSELEAAIAYDELAKRIYGPFARLNFQDHPTHN